MSKCYTINIANMNSLSICPWTAGNDLYLSEIIIVYTIHTFN